MAKDGIRTSVGHYARRIQVGTSRNLLRMIDALTKLCSLKRWGNDLDTKDPF